MLKRLGFRLAVLLTVVTALALPFRASAAAYQQTIQLRIPVAGETFVNPCTGELLTVTGGTFFIVVHLTVDDAGGLHIAAEGQAQNVSAVGSTGTTYRLTGGFWGAQNATAGGAFAWTEVGVFNVISRGGGDNFVEHTSFNLKVNANGEVTVDNFDFSGECRG